MGKVFTHARLLSPVARHTCTCIDAVFFLLYCRILWHVVSHLAYCNMLRALCCLLLTRRGVSSCGIYCLNVTYLVLSTLLQRVLSCLVCGRLVVACSAQCMSRFIHCNMSRLLYSTAPGTCEHTSYSLLPTVACLRTQHVARLVTYCSISRLVKQSSLLRFAPPPSNP